MTLTARTILRLAIGLVVGITLVFLPAGSFRFWEGWVFIIGELGSFIVFSILLLKWDPQLMERRLHAQENEPEQRVFQKLWGLIFFPALMLPGFDFRFGWSHMAVWVAVAGQAAMMAGTFLIFGVMRANTFAARTVQVEAGQTVISTGPYALVRHPMYAGIAITMLATPLALGSYVALTLFALLLPLLVFRLIHEERILRRDLPGYAEYCERTRSVWCRGYGNRR